MSNNKELFEKLTHTPDDTLTRSIERVDDLDDNDKEIQKQTRRDDYHLGKNLKRIKLVASWGVAIILGAMLCAFISAFTYLFYKYIQDVGTDLAQVKELLKSWLDYILIVMATLFVQHIFEKRNK